MTFWAHLFVLYLFFDWFRSRQPRDRSIRFGSTILQSSQVRLPLAANDVPSHAETFWNWNPWRRMDKIRIKLIAAGDTSKWSPRQNVFWHVDSAGRFCDWGPLALRCGGEINPPTEARLRCRRLRLMTEGLLRLDESKSRGGDGGGGEPQQHNQAKSRDRRIFF